MGRAGALLALGPRGGGADRAPHAPRGLGRRARPGRAHERSRARRGQSAAPQGLFCASTLCASKNCWKRGINPNPAVGIDGMDDFKAAYHQESEAQRIYFVRADRREILRFGPACSGGFASKNWLKRGQIPYPAVGIDEMDDFKAAYHQEPPRVPCRHHWHLVREILVETRAKSGGNR